MLSLRLKNKQMETLILLQIVHSPTSIIRWNTGSLKMSSRDPSWMSLLISAVQVSNIKEADLETFKANIGKIISENYMALAITKRDPVRGGRKLMCLFVSTG